MKKVLIILLFSLGVFGLALNAHALLFDLAGNGGADPSTVIDFNVFDWGVSGALIQGDIPIPQGGGSHTIYTHASLSSFKKDNSNVTLPSGYVLDDTFEVTVVVGFGETSTQVTPTVATFEFDPTNPVNFFEIYIDDADADGTLGTNDTVSGINYNDGTLILSGYITDSDGVFSVTSTNPDLLDQHGDDDLGGQQTVGGTGSTTLSASVAPAQINTNYFIDVPSNFYFVLDDTSNNALPFKQGDPQTYYWNGTQYIKGLTAGNDWNVGQINGVSGPDMTVQTDGSTKINVVPEPATFALLGWGLIGLGAASRRKRRQG